MGVRQPIVEVPQVIEDNHVDQVVNEEQVNVEQPIKQPIEQKVPQQDNEEH